MPTVRANDIDIYYEQQGAGEPLVLIPYLAIDQACYAFQVADYAKHYTCISVDLRGAGQTGARETVSIRSISSYLAVEPTTAAKE
jgi:3-oxoadipate enol-lactonase